MSKKFLHSLIQHIDRDEEDDELIDLHRRTDGGLGEESPDDAPEGFESVDEALAFDLPHRVYSVAHLNWDFLESESMEMNLADDFALVVIAIRSGVDEFGSLARIDPETGLTVGHPEAIEEPGDDIANPVREYLVPRHASGIDEAAPEGDLG